MKETPQYFDSLFTLYFPDNFLFETTYRQTTLTTIFMITIPEAKAISMLKTTQSEDFQMNPEYVGAKFC